MVEFYVQTHEKDGQVNENSCSQNLGMLELKGTS